MPDKDIKVGVQRGGGPPPGYLWDVLILDLAFEDAKKFLNDDQYDYIADQIKTLATEQDPGHSVLCSVDAIEDFFELREKYGPLGRMNVRVFFAMYKDESKSIVVLGAMKKENNGPTPPGDVLRMRRRLRRYEASRKV